MPLLKIQLSTPVIDTQQDALLGEASALVAEKLAKPEAYVMVSLEHNPLMSFAGSRDPCAYLELKSIGLPENQVAHLSTSLCDLVETATGIKKDRIYIEFSNAPRSMWGWNGKTF